MKAKPISLTDLIDDETEFSILITVYTFKSLNLKQLSTLMEIPESTLLRKMKDLIKYEVLVLDNHATMEKRGKYYCLSDDIQHMIDTQDFQPVVLSKDGKEKFYQTLQKARSAMMGISGINFQLAKITSKFFEALPEMGLKVKEKKIIVSASHMILNFKTLDQMHEYNELFKEFFQKIEKFEKQKNTPQEYVHTFHSFSSPIGLIQSTKFIEKLNQVQKQSKS